MVDREFGSAGERVVFEEFLVGDEASYFVLADGVALRAASSLRITSGSSTTTRPEHRRHGRILAEPARDPARSSGGARRDRQAGARRHGAEGHPYRGFLYVGLMLTADGPKVIEFNVRFGDPEAQVVLPMLDEDLSWLLGRPQPALPSRPARFRDEPHVGVVLASRGYPESPRTGKPIDGVDEANEFPARGLSRRDRATRWSSRTPPAVAC